MTRNPRSGNLGRNLANACQLLLKNDRTHRMARGSQRVLERRRAM